MAEWEKIQEKWVKRWKDERVFEALPDEKKKKFFGTFPYPYINLYPHIGHFYSLMKLEAVSRYKRMMGFNVLYTQGWHATGSPIVNAAKRVKSGEEKQIAILKKMGFSDEEVKLFEDPKHWIKVFGAGWKEDLIKAGCSIDWRRNFHTTSLNPHYDRFVRWQFKRLKEHGRVVKGKKPVIYCLNCDQAIGDHARVLGEGETPQQFSLFKFKLDDGRFIITATLRPDTVMGITNLYVNPDETYQEIIVNGKTWIVGKPIIKKLELQDYEVTRKDDVLGESLVGEWVESFSGVKIPVLPAFFLTSDYGTGMVHSVPSDSADDLIALQELKENKDLLEKYGLDVDRINAIKVIEIFDTPGIGGNSAQHFLTKYKVTSQKDRGKLEKIKKELYTLTYNEATFNDLYTKAFSKDLKGMKVKDGQEFIKEELHKKGVIDYFYEPTGKVVCRCLNEAVIKIVKDQWFLAYGDTEWKKIAHNCLDRMRLFPEKARAQFNYVVDWLNDWACTHHSESELGTLLPWDDKWMIESLSDSTIYMAYYTIAHLIKKIDPDELDEKVFDFVFLGKGKCDDFGKNRDVVKEMKKEFDYWYPMDLRTSGKDLIQNHLTFSIFNHCDIFDEKDWPKAFAVNGWVTVDGNKMSKSLGNVIPVRTMISEFGSDASRFTVLSGGEGLDDANWDTELARSMKEKLLGFPEYAKRLYSNGREGERTIDRWFSEQLKLIVKDTTDAYENMLFRTAIQKTYFEMGRIVKWYLRRTNDEPNLDLMKRVIEIQIKMLSPIIPFICEEAWEAIGKEGMVCLADWPSADGDVDEALLGSERIIENTIDDIKSVLKLAKVDLPKKVRLFVAEDWKYQLVKKVSMLLEKTRNFGEIMKSVMQDEAIKMHPKECAKIIQRIIKAGKAMAVVGESKAEYDILADSREFLEKEFKTTVEIVMAEESKEGKARQAMPNKPAILVE